MCVIGKRKTFFKRYFETPLKTRLGFVFALLFSVVFLPEGALAANTLGEVICNIGINTGPFTFILGAVCYIAGAFFAIYGVLLLKKHFDNPNDSQIVKATACLLSAGFLSAFPKFAGALQKTVFKSVAAGGGEGCTPGAVAALSSGGLDLVLKNFIENIGQPMVWLLSILSYCIGALFIARGLMKSAKVGTDPRAGAPSSIINHFIIGAILISMGEMEPAILKSIFGSSTVDDIKSFAGINWSTITGGATPATTAVDNTVKAILMFVQIVGVIGFLRGWLIIKNAVEGSGQATVPQGLAHIIGGAMAINIGSMLQIIDKTFGTGLIL